MWDFKRGTPIRIKDNPENRYVGCEGIVERELCDRYACPIFEVYIYSARKTFYLLPEWIEYRKPFQNREETTARTERAIE